VARLARVVAIDVAAGGLPNRPFFVSL